MIPTDIYTILNDAKEMKIEQRRTKRVDDDELLGNELWDLVAVDRQAWPPHRDLTKIKLSRQKRKRNEIKLSHVKKEMEK